MRKNSKQVLHFALFCKMIIFARQELKIHPATLIGVD